VAKFSSENAREMAAKAVAAKRERKPRDVRAFAEVVMSDRRVQANILKQARNGELPAATVTLLATYVAGRPKDAPPPVVTRDLVAEARERLDRLTTWEQRVHLALTRKGLGRPSDADRRVLADLAKSSPAHAGATPGD